MDLAMEHESAVRLGFFFGILVLMAIWEYLAPRRRPTVARSIRWLSNLSLVAINTVVLRAVFPVLAVGLALLAEERGWGLLNNVMVPHWLAIVLALLLLDMAIYLQHVMFHAIPMFWRLHMVHHADLDFDVTTGARFHTIEIILSMCIKMAVVMMLGPPAVAVVIFEVALNGTSLFNHGNVRLPIKLDRYLRLLVVTPDMHRVHHSVVVHETNSNFGFNLPWWDRIFGTYRDQPAAGHDGMTIGLTQYRDTKVTRLHWMLALPFVGKLGSYPINQRRPN
jgi:sterol desaturase/sphingolipid hydroxylase (fatty acid hydroxylase superfamily)